MITLERITLIINLLDEIHNDIQHEDGVMFRKYGERLNITKSILREEENELTPGTKFWDCIRDIAGRPVVFWDHHHLIALRIRKVDPVILDAIAVQNSGIKPRELKISHLLDRLLIYDVPLVSLLDQVFHSEPDCK